MNEHFDQIQLLIPIHFLSTFSRFRLHIQNLIFS